VIIAAIGVMAFVLGFSIWSLFKLDAEIAKFTAPGAKPVPVAAVAGAEAACNDLQARLEVFRGDLVGDPVRASSLALDPADLNRAIALFDELSELRGRLHVAAVEGGQLLLEVSFPMNARPLSGGSRFLNATLVARPELHPGEVVLTIAEIRVPGAVVPQEFLGHFSPYRPLERYRNHPHLGPAMRRLTGIAVHDGRVVVRRVPGESPPAAITPQQARAGSSRLFRTLGLVACLFLPVAGTVVFVVLRRAARTRPPADPPRV
jgi:hypothetical protein